LQKRVSFCGIEVPRIFQSKESVCATAPAYFSANERAANDMLVRNGPSDKMRLQISSASSASTAESMAPSRMANSTASEKLNVDDPITTGLA
jgi:hypothetical protein